MTPETAQPLIECRGVTKRYGKGELAVDVLQGLDLTLHEGEDLAITGASGSGKSTLLHLLGGLDSPNHGVITVRGKTISQLDERELCHWRNQKIGFVYQFHYLFAEFTVIENVAMPLLITGNKLAEVRDRAMSLLERAGLDRRAQHKPHELSGGERQRVAVCRALVALPKIILADEPTGSLDQETARKVTETMFRIKAESGATLVIVTHDETLARKCIRTTHLENGCLR